MMKRKLSLLILVCTSVMAIGQSKDIRIFWNEDTKTAEKRISKEEQRDRLLSRLNLVVDKNTSSFDSRWLDRGFADSRSVEIVNTKWADLSVKEIQQLNPKIIPSTLEYSLQSALARDKIYTTISISPIVNRNGRLQKLLSFTVTYRYGSAPVNRTRMPISQSVLATGDWYRFQIDKTGIYKVDRSFLADIGMNTNDIDPAKIKIYGFGGKPLPLANDENFIFDLPEISIQVVGGDDGSFDNGDYLLFYGQGVEGYDSENDTNLNPYSDEVYYYVTASGNAGKRVQAMVEPTGNPNVIIREFQEERFHEEDEFSPAKVGRQWFGNRFDIESEQRYEFSFENLVVGKPVRVGVRAAASSEVATSLAVSVNSTTVDPLTFNPINDPTLLSVDSFVSDIPVSGGTVSLDLAYNNSGNPSSIGYLDYIRVEATRNLVGTGQSLIFKNKEVGTQSGIGEYEISNAAGFSQVWDVTRPDIVSFKLNEGANSNFTFKASLGEVRTYVAIVPSNYLNPIKGNNNRVTNQDLKGSIFLDNSGTFKDIDYLIIVPPFLIQPALRIANHHRNVSGLNVKVVTTDKIYNEFSSGKQDISAIRNFVRYVYENASNFDKRLKYLCLFGDTSVDYKDRLPDNNNIVPTYHTLSSVDTFNSFMSDDFYGMMDPNEGTMSASHSLDIAVGRIVVDEVSLANSVVDKIISYQEKASYGNWRNTFVLISDDVDVSWEYRALEVTLDSIGDRVTAEKPFINVKKIHIDSYQQETSAGGNRYPEAKEAVENAIEVGALIVNYFGHGGEDGLAKEFIYTKETAQDLRNTNRYPCFVTVTCEFSKFDNPQRITAGELTFWNKEGGAASLITTTRSVSVTLGVDFNELLAEILFGFGLDTPPHPSEALRLTKNEIANSNNKRVIFYIGDPAMPLAFPKKSIRLNTINDLPVGSSADTLKALSRIKMGGEVLDENGNVLNNYNGVVEVKVFDKDLQRATLGNDGIRDNGTDYDNDGDTTNLLLLNFKTLGEVLFSGQASVTNGQFQFEFVVPKDVQVPVGNGKVSFYSQQFNSLVDQTGYNLNIVVGGINENAPADTQGPYINLFMNEESFVSGGVTNDSPILLAKLEDENGINTSSGIGHDIIAILDGDEANPFVLNEYYQAEVDDYTKGMANYKLRDLADGLHTLTVKAWDVYNNSSTSEIQFVVAGDDKLKITRVLNYPNPFVNYTEFWFNHNRPLEPLQVQVQVFTVTGKVVWTQNQIINTEGFLSRDIIWNGKDDFGDSIGKGVYVYKLTVKSTLTGQQVEKFEKLVIL